MFIGNQEKILKILLNPEEFDFYKSCIFSITFNHMTVADARFLLIKKIGKDRYKFLQESMQKEFDGWCKERGVTNGN